MKKIYIHQFPEGVKAELTLDLAPGTKSAAVAVEWVPGFSTQFLKAHQAEYEAWKLESFQDYATTTGMSFNLLNL